MPWLSGPPAPTTHSHPGPERRPAARMVGVAEPAAAGTYRVLARKYRPRTFAEVVGQEHIVRALTRAIARGRIGQAYLMVGPRGVGKTSTARILARALNCVQGPTAEPCLECEPCLEIESGADVDVIEIDGASHNSVDDVRQLRDTLATRPLRDRYKVVIVDEVQRLSGSAFDALLKTLEEPPSHAVFQFATTDPHKIPETIVSRCQVFEFRRLREEDVRLKLVEICEREGIAADEAALAALARGCRGGLRDAESMLDQVAAVAEDRITLDDLELVAGLARPERWLDLFEAVAEDRGDDVLRAVAGFLERGGTERDFVEQAADALRDLLHVALLGEDALGVEPAPERRERMRALAKAFGRDRLEAILGMLFELEGRLQRSPLAARALLEWTLLRAARLGRLLDLAELAERLAAADAGAPGGTAAATSAAPPPVAAPASAAAAPAAPAAPDAERSSRTTEPVPAAASDFASLLARLRERRPTLAECLERNLLTGRVESDRVVVELRPPSEGDRAMLEDPVERGALERVPGSPGPWELCFLEDSSGPPDPVVQSLLDTFGGQEESP